MILTIALAALASLPTLAEPPSRYAPLAKGHDLGVAAVHVESGKTDHFGAGDRFAMASTVKLPLAVAVLKAADRGKLNLDTTIVIGKAELRHGMGKRLGTGTYTVRALLDAMMKESDNTATDALFRLVGGPAAVRGMLVEAGVSGIDVERTEGELFAQFTKGGPSAGDARDTATPEAMAKLLVQLQQGKLLGKAHTTELLDLMRGCRTGDERIRAGVPKGTEVADKTGTMEPVTSDVGLVTLPDGTHLALAVYVRGGRDREKVIAAVAREAWEAFTKAH